MISSSHILTIGPEYNPPKGGVAQCIATYGETVFSDFQVLTNSCEGSPIKKLWKAISSLILLFFILLFKHRISIVHIHTASYNSFKRSSFFVRLSKAMNRKVVIHIHGGGFREYRKNNPEFVDKNLRKCDAIVALSKTWYKYFADELGLQNVFVVHNIIEKPQIMRAQEDGIFHILFLGLITESKGIFDLLDAMHDHKEEWHNRIVLHVGGNGKVNQFKQLVVDYQLEDMVVYEGWVSGDKKATLFSLANAYILPSYTEGMPISILESMIYGVPVLSTPVGGIPEVIHTGENGILFKPGDKPAIADAINQLINNKELCVQMSKREQEEAKNYLPEYIECQLSMVYNSI